MSLRRNKSFVFLTLLLAFMLLAAACAQQGDDTGADVTDEGEPQQGGTMTYISEQFTPHLMCDKADNNLAWCAYPMRAVLLGAYEVQPDFSYVPDLLAQEVEIDEGPPFTGTWTLKEEAQWSDGTPITSRDLEFTWETYTNPDNDVISREGYDQIESAEIVDEKTITFTFKDTYVPYRDLFDYVYPAHVLEDENWNNVWRRCVCNPDNGEPIASGPFVWSEFRPNQSFTLTANENWWGEEGPYLDEIFSPYVAETQTEIQQLRGGEVDMIYPSPQPELRALANIQGIVNEVGAGPSWQHLDFQFDHPLLGELWMRQAIAHAIDRQAIVDQLIIPIYPEGSVLNNNIYVSNQEEYEPHFDIYEYDPDRARQLMEDNGCTEGNDGIYVCNGERASFSYLSTAGNRLRELMFQIIQQNLQDAGIEVTNDFAEADVVFGPRGLTGKNYELIQFAWVGSPDPSGGNSIWICEGAQNYNNYCNEEVTKLIESTDRLLDPAERTAAYNQADELMAQDLPVLPLWQYPQPMAYDDAFHGFENNTTEWGPLWNAEQIWMEQGAAN